MTLSPLELLKKLAALVPLPRVHLVRYGGCLAPHSLRRDHADATSAERGRARGQQRRAALELGLPPARARQATFDWVA